MARLEKLVLWLAIYAVLVVPAGVTIWGWWTTTEAPVKYGMTALSLGTETVEIFVALGLAAAFAARDVSRLLGLLVIGALLVALNAYLIHPGLEKIWAMRGAVLETVDVDTMQRDLADLEADRSALNSIDWTSQDDVIRGQALVARHGAVELRGGFDGDAGDATAKAVIMVSGKLAEQIKTARRAVDEAKKQNAQARIDRIAFFGAIAGLALFKLLGRWAFQGLLIGAKARAVIAGANDNADVLEFPAWDGRGKPPPLPPEYHWKNRDRTDTRRGPYPARNPSRAAG